MNCSPALFKHASQLEALNLVKRGEPECHFRFEGELTKAVETSDSPQRPLRRQIPNSLKDSSTTFFLRLAKGSQCQTNFQIGKDSQKGSETFKTFSIALQNSSSFKVDYGEHWLSCEIPR